MTEKHPKEIDSKQKEIVDTLIDLWYHMSL
jgi:hypothetical protein